ncbi:MAG: hypothetical protein AAGA54_22660 [Myxococcota bacterium]
MGAWLVGGCGDDGSGPADTDGAGTEDATSVASTSTASTDPTTGITSVGSSDTSETDPSGAEDSSSSSTGTPVGPSCPAAPQADRTGTDGWNDANGNASVTIDDPEAERRTYTLSTTASLVDNLPNNPRILIEQSDDATLRSGHDLFDALYTLSLEETRENSVESIQDFAFNNGAEVPCGGCFETGRKWNYVWTRDTAYAVDLGLAGLDPMRARNSLDFKLSERRGGGDLQIVQDTGTGGSYPVSSDRVSWAVGAWELLAQLDGEERDAFAARTLEALTNTLDHDRGIVYDPADGLYYGEQSFLDWREQTYPEWTAGDVVHIGMSKALSTNLLHYRAMRVAASLADEAGDAKRRDRFEGWADALRTAIRDHFWLEDEGQFSTFITTGLDVAPVRRFDLLGSSFAVLFDVATEAQAAQIVAGYPHYGPGAPVAWPQLQNIPIYHNRGEWPFVTAYWLRAAAKAGNATVAEKMMRALIRGAAVNLSNMENFEAASGAPWVDEGPSSGPVVNSQRQLWSVAAYVSMVHHTLFGLQAEEDGLHVRPFVPAGLRTSLFAGTNEIVLNDFRYRGRSINVVLALPEDAGTGALQVDAMFVGETEIEGDLLEGLEDGDCVYVRLTAGAGDDGDITETTDANWQDVFSPRTPQITGVSGAGGQVTLDLATTEASDVTWRIYRDGEVVADALPGSTTSWTDPDFDANGSATPCYVAELTFTSSGTHSQHSTPQCWWGPGSTRVTLIGASSMVNEGGVGSTNHGRFHYEAWGDDGHTLTVPSFTPSQSGTHLFQVGYGNGAGPVSTGITCAVKRVVVEEVVSGDEVAREILIMPHLGDWSIWALSSFAEADLTAGVEYRVTIEGDDDAVNMSSFSHFEAYTGGLGGSDGVFNRVNISDLRVLAR